MRARTTLATALTTLTVALTAAGCGGAGGAGSSDLGGAASVAPSNAIGFVALDSNVSSGQWQAVDGLLKKFPSQGDLMTKLQDSLQKDANLNWATDVQPALGSELDLVALPGTGAAKKPLLVGLTQPGDQSKLGALLKKLDKNIVSAQVGGWTAFSDSQAALDAMQGATAKLADNNTYRAAVAKLSTDALVRAYANGTEAQQLLDSLGPQAPSSSATTVPFAWASADVVAAGDGVRVNGYSQDGSLVGVPANRLPVPAQPYASTLVDEIPSGAILVADFPIAPAQFDAYDMGPTSPLGKLFGPNATTVASELDSLFGGETALYVRPGLPIPEITLVTQPSDTAAATAALTDVVARLKQAAGSKLGGFNLSSIQLVHAVVGGQFVVSTSQQGLADFQSGGAKLSSDPAFKSAVQAAGMPDRTTGFLYVNLASALPLVQTVGPFLGLKLPATGQSDTAALQSFVAYGTRSGDQSGLTAFLQVH